MKTPSINISCHVYRNRETTGTMAVGMTSDLPTLSMFVMVGVFLTRLVCSTHLTAMVIVGTSTYHDWVKLCLV